MEKLKYTPGPWIAHTDNVDEYIDIDSNGPRICSVFIANENGDTLELDTEYNEENKANAKLIASAPDMLESLIELHKLFSHYHNLHIQNNMMDQEDEDALNKAEKAIQKAVPDFKPYNSKN